MFYRHMKDFQEDNSFKAINHHWVNSDKISKYTFAAVIAAEDQGFYQHQGFDSASIKLAVETWLDGGRLRGASTISQQAFWSKKRILEVYLNSIEFGDHLFGIEAASQHYFGISSMRLSRKQSALLATSLPNPIKFNVAKPSAYMRQRQSWILRQMRNLGY
jgi:monofunctional biosynthetic peptidoglycan transglycosylase